MDPLDHPSYTVTTGASGTYWPAQPRSLNKIALALVNAQAEVHTAGKSGDNKFDKYTYSKLEDFLAVAKPVLAKHRIAMVLDAIETQTLDDRQTKNGGIEHAVRVKVRCTLYHESGEELVFYGYGEGQDRADKAIYKALTGAKKYAVAGALAIPTSDDPEADEKVGLSSGKGREKLDSQGNVQTKIPKWTDQQKIEAGQHNSAILALLEAQYGNADAAQDELQDWKNRHKYDAPDDVLKALARWKNDLQGLP